MGVCAAGDEVSLHGRWAEAISQTLQLALKVTHLAPSHCRAWTEVTGCWLGVRPSGPVPWLAISSFPF